MVGAIKTPLYIAASEWGWYAGREQSNNWAAAGGSVQWRQGAAARLPTDKDKLVQA